MDIHKLRYRILRSVMEARHLNLRGLANIIDRSESQTSSFAGANPSKNIGEKMARHIETALGLPLNYLDDSRHLGAQEPQGANEINNAAVISPAQRMLPVVGQASAGTLIDNIEEADIEEWVYAPGPCGEGAFVLRLEGISMEPDFYSGDRIVIDPSLEWKSGDFVFARRNCSNTGTFKQLKYEDGVYYLCATNPDWKPKYLALDEEWQIVGKARYQVKIL